jgi:hypothetical protein
MATAVITDYKIYHDEYFAGLAEVSAQNADVFNQRSAGAFRVIPAAAKEGDYEKASYFKNISGLITRRDDTDTTSTPTAVKPTQEEYIAVKVKRQIGPVEYTLDGLKSIGVTPELFSFYLGQQVAKQRLLEQLSIGVRALVGAIVNVGATLIRDVSATSVLTTPQMIRGRALFGDAWMNIVSWVMHSLPMTDLAIDQAAAGLDIFSGMALGKGTPQTLGLPYVVTDEAQLIDSANYYTLGLTEGAIMIKEEAGEDPPYLDIVTGKPNLIARVQGEYAFTLGLKGYKWAGSRNPADATVGTGSNWTKIATSIKDTAGFALKTAISA